MLSVDREVALKAYDKILDTPFIEGGRVYFTPLSVSLVCDCSSDEAKDICKTLEKLLLTEVHSDNLGLDSVRVYRILFPTEIVKKKLDKR